MEHLKELVGLIGYGIKNKIAPSIQYKRVKLWLSHNKNGDLLYTFDIDNNSIVFDVGGYKGEWARDIFCKYNCRLFIFEPVQAFYADIVNKFIKNDLVKVENFGLGGTSETLHIALGADGSSLFKETNNSEVCRIVAIDSYIKEANISKISLLKLNIEGSEFDLLEKLLSSGLITKVDNILVQFHDFAPNADKRMATLRSHLEKTHENVFTAEYVWEHWHLKKDV